MNERNPNTSEPERPSDATLRRVWLDNVRDNQIGGKTDGITGDVAADMGYLPPSNMDSSDELNYPSEGPTPLLERNETEIDAAQDRHPTSYGRTSFGPKKRPSRGPVRGDSELDTGKPMYYEEFTMTPKEQAEQAEINKRGAQQAREAMRITQDENQDNSEQS